MAVGIQENSPGRNLTIRPGLDKPSPRGTIMVLLSKSWLPYRMAPARVNAGVVLCLPFGGQKSGCVMRNPLVQSRIAAIATLAPTRV